jgi:hypothetical protein
VFKLLKLLVSLVCLGVFVWWGLTVQLGQRTLFGHIAAIGSSKESKELVRGTKEKVAEVKKRLVDESGSKGLTVPGEAPPADAPPAKAHPPQERLTRADRRDIKRLLDAKRGKPAAGAPN